MLLCCTCVIYKRVTDDEAFRTFYLLKKLSREWPLLNNVTWEQNGDFFTDIVFGSYIIITLGLLIGYLCGELRNGRKMEKFFLGMGALLFIIVGSLVYASLDSVPPDLVDNAAVLGTLALFTGLLFLLDIGLSRPKPPPIKQLYKATQTDIASNSVDLLDKVHRVPNGNKVIGELRSSLKTRRRADDDDSRYPPHRDSTPDLMMQGHSLRSRGITEEQMTPEGYRRNGHFSPDQRLDHGRQLHDSSVRQDLRFPSDLQLRHQPESHRSVDRISSDKDQERRDIPTRDQRPSDSRHGLDHRTSEQENSNSSSGEQRYLEQGEISQRPESITPEQKHRTRPREMYRESDSDLDDPTHIPTVSFLLTERGEPVEVRPGGSKRSLRIKPQQTGKGSIKDTKLLPMMPVASTSEDIMGMQRKRSIILAEDEPKQKHFGHEETRSPAAVPDEREKEKSAFGTVTAGKTKASSSRSLDIEAVRFEDVSQSPSPDIGHWRYDSRDANIVRPERELPSSPSDPGFVRYTAHNWPDSSPRTPSHSPADSVTPGGSRVQNWPDSQPRTPSQSPQTWSGSAVSFHQGPESHSRTPSQSAQELSESVSRSPLSHQAHWPQSRPSSDEGDYAAALPPPPPSEPPASHHQQVSSTRRSRSANQRHDEEEEDNIDEDIPSGGSLTTQLLQKWLKQRKSKAGKTKSNP
ncbi:uncharacterized protein LOC110838262 isoform X2 [Zootermopsis nevadensis]|uniref:uncharacterized protein LOC110838262 isoform X2 n=1 Tax=Zootermopsis nevadensis TaxID=136037 RepID=UPI000B8E96CC|nr:uncharacterized protein LOC110838262 isoform X2 [Zootermopsis nevadensis]